MAERKKPTVQPRIPQYYLLVKQLALPKYLKNSRDLPIAQLSLLE